MSERVAFKKSKEIKKLNHRPNLFMVKENDREHFTELWKDSVCKSPLGIIFCLTQGQLEQLGTLSCWALVSPTAGDPTTLLRNTWEHLTALVGEKESSQNFLCSKLYPLPFVILLQASKRHLALGSVPSH